MLICEKRILRQGQMWKEIVKRVLGHKTNKTRTFKARHWRDISSIELYGAGVRHLVPSDYLQKSGFACAVAADNPQYLASLNSETETIKYDQPPTRPCGEGLTDVLHA
jgi:hypothetical protein